MAFTMSNGRRSIFLFGASMAVLLLLLKWLEGRFLIMTHALDIYIGAIALVFLALGIWLSNKLFQKTKTIVIEKEILVQNFKRDENQIRKLGLSPRELEVLELMAGGLSNQEIADSLFVSVNTIKTHNSNILAKLDVKRRTQAIDTAKKLGIIA